MYSKLFIINKQKDIMKRMKYGSKVLLYASLFIFGAAISDGLNSFFKFLDFLFVSTCFLMCMYNIGEGINSWKENC